jgi:hypothetical protein
VLDQVAQQFAGETLVVDPLGVAKDIVERPGIRLLDSMERVLQRLPHVSNMSAHIAPVAAGHGVGDRPEW